MKLLKLKATSPDHISDLSSLIQDTCCFESNMFFDSAEKLFYMFNHRFKWETYFGSKEKHNTSKEYESGNSSRVNSGLYFLNVSDVIYSGIDKDTHILNLLTLNYQTDINKDRKYLELVFSDNKYIKIYFSDLEVYLKDYSQMWYCELPKHYFGEK